MLDSDEIDERLREIMTLGLEGDVHAQVTETLEIMNRRDDRIASVLEELLEEVDELIRLTELLEEDEEGLAR
ncbi:MAG: hypothetical protein GKC10_06560 [Methanosarcinales archaeon]|nr:hypothetical protein [Methanosarcinales archaeon]